MSQIISTYKRLIHSNKVLVNRSLPEEGDLIVNVGDTVEPFSKLGGTKISMNMVILPEGIKLSKKKKSEKYISLTEKESDKSGTVRSLDMHFYKNEVIGRVGLKKVVAPFSGTVYEKTKSKQLIFREEKKDYWLLSGVWGKVNDIVAGNSVLIETQSLDIHMTACTNMAVQGELIIFPNPSELLQMHYLEKFTKDVHGKVLYIGDFVGLNALRKASDLGATGVLAGSADRQSFSYAIKNDLFLGVFSGFGKIPTPKNVYEALKPISNRYVFLEGDKNIVRIPMPDKFESPVVKSDIPKDIFRTPEVGDRVLVLETQNFGLEGQISSIQEDTLHVILDNAGEVETPWQNVLFL